MGNLLADAVAWLQEERKLSLSEAGVYQRGALSVPSLAATRVRSEFLISDDTSTRIETDLVDWIVTASDLVLGGQPAVPQRGDTFTVAGVAYDVVQPDPNHQPFRLDITGQQFRFSSRARS
jgi:hypothetical protein